MNRRHLLLLLLGLAAWPPRTAFADDGEDEGDSGEDDSGDDSGVDTSDDGNDGSGGDNGGDGGGGEDGEGGGQDGENGAGGDHDSALKAVEAEGALSLDEFLPQFRRQVKGRVVDVSVKTSGGKPIFIVTFVDPDGRVRRGRFDARTGKLMES